MNGRVSRATHGGALCTSGVLQGTHKRPFEATHLIQHIFIPIHRPTANLPTPESFGTICLLMPLNLSFFSLFAFLSALARLSVTLAFPSYGSLAGLSERDLDALIARLPQVTPGVPPNPLKFNGTKLVHDSDHPWKALRKGDMRGPCPGLNTLASHGVSLQPAVTYLSP